MIDEMLKIWAAGFFDGEGTALTSENNPGNTLGVLRKRLESIRPSQSVH